MLFVLCLFFVSIPFSITQTSQTTIRTTATTKSTTTRKNDCVQLSPYCTCLGGPEYIYCNNFTSFSQLDFTLLGEKRNITYITFVPKQPLILNNSLNLNGIELKENVVFNNIVGIDLNENPFIKWTPKDNLSLQFFSSNFSQLMPCDKNLINENFKPIFSSFKTILFGYRNIYSAQLCPLLFYNSSLSYLNISDLTYSGQPWFSDLRELSTIHSKIDTLLIPSGQNTRITKSLMNRLIFENLKTVLISNTILQKIDDDAFSDIFNMRFLNFSIVNFEKFFKNSTNKWMQSLNTKIRVDYSNPEWLNANQNNSLLVNLNPLYSSFFFYFTDEDYENFQYFPHDNFVFARISMLYPLKCSKTMNFLLKNFEQYPLDLSNLNTTATYECLANLLTSPTYSSTLSTTPNSSIKLSENFKFIFSLIFIYFFAISI
ncbi:unnamed protein product [Brachionus calyciflorus]|uniref:Uncharacterized protein n=1 Tax=Brachionus calyciflorus TaxID=104777 RepID=A0A814B915_9BILA|nr:unnamed protein product [Brachionus calyciflorus]